jgi:hypothetical protein
MPPKSWVLECRAGAVTRGGASNTAPVDPLNPPLFLHTPSTLAAALFHHHRRPRREQTGADAVHPQPTEADLVASFTAYDEEPGAMDGDPHLLTAADVALMAKLDEGHTAATEQQSSSAAPPLLPPLRALAALYGRALGPALRIVMSAKQEVAVLFTRRSLRTVYRVSGHPCLGAQYCSCSAFRYLVVNKGEHEHCKHQIALLLLHRFDPAFPLQRRLPARLLEALAAQEEQLQRRSPPQGLPPPHRSSGAHTPQQHQSPLQTAPAALQQAGSPFSPGAAAAPPLSLARASGSTLGGTPVVTTTFTDDDGIAWIEISEVEFRSIITA